MADGRSATTMGLVGSSEKASPPQVRGHHAAEGFYIWATPPPAGPVPSLPATIGAVELGERIRDASI